jgi:hypothetical protein
MPPNGTAHCRGRAGRAGATACIIVRTVLIDNEQPELIRVARSAVLVVPWHPSSVCSMIRKEAEASLGRISPSFPQATPALHHPPHLTRLPPSQSLRRGLCLRRIFLLPPRSESELDRPLGLLLSRLLLVTPPAPILFKWEVESHLIQHVLVLFEIATKAPCQNSHSDILDTFARLRADNDLSDEEALLINRGVSVHASHEALTLHSPVAHPSLTLAHPAREVRVFKAAWCE